MVAGLAQSLNLSSQDACAPGLVEGVSVLGGAYIAVCNEHVEAAAHFLTALSSVIWCVHSCVLSWLTTESASSPCKCVLRCAHRVLKQAL